MTTVATELPHPLRRLLDELVLAQAAEHARAGRYAEAERLLAETESLGEPELGRRDLHARICVQQGRFLEAEQLWRRAVETDGGNETYRAGLRRLGQLRQRPIWLSSVLAALAGIALLAAVFLVAVLVVQEVGQIRDDVSSQTARTAAAQEEAAARLSELEARLTRQSGESSAAPALRIALPGVSTRREGDELVVVFDRGLFARGTELTRSGRSRLAAVARRVAPHAQEISIRVVGFTDNAPLSEESPYRDNVALGLARAVSVAELLRTNGRLPVAALSAASLGNASTPFTNDTAAGRARNRTVVLRIRAAG